jgi:Lrp/AsnC family transcriptional regulator for asnA, asnC and gidA
LKGVEGIAAITNQNRIVANVNIDLIQNICFYLQIGIAMIDEIDQKLIELLMSDSRQSSRVLADKLGLDGSTVRRRVKKLVENGVVFYSVLPNPDVLGFPVKAIVALNIAPGKVSEAIEKLSNVKEIKWISPTTGRFDVILFVWLSSIEVIYNFIENVVGKVEGVKNAETFICLSNDYDSMPY